MTEQNEQPKTMSVTLTIPEGNVVIMVPTPLSAASASTVAMWLAMATSLDGVEVKE